MGRKVGAWSFALSGALGCLGCKVTNNQSTLRDAELPTSAPPVSAPTAGTGAGVPTQAGQPLAGVQFGAGAWATGSCFPGAAAAWSDPGSPAYPTPELVPPGTTRFVHGNKVTSAYTGWTRNVHESIPTLEVFDTRVDTFDDLTGRFVSGDAGAINWHLSRDFGTALSAALANQPAANNHYGVVLMRKIVANQQLAGAAPVPQAVAATAASYGSCGDAYLSGQVFADNFLLVLASPDGGQRDTAMDRLRDLALNKGDFDQTLTAADQALQGSALMVLETGDAGLRFTTHVINEAEGAMNTWRGSDTPTGIRSLLGVGTAYDAYTGADPSTAQLNPSLLTLAAGTDGLRAMAADARTTKQQQLASLADKIQSCGGRRFSADASGPAASCTQLFAAGLSSSRVQSVHFDTYAILGGYPGNPCAFETLVPPTLQRHAGRAEFTSLMADPVFKNIIYNRYFANRNQGNPSYGPTWTQKYEYFWIRPAAADAGKVAARLEDKRTNWSAEPGVNGRNPNPYTPDYPFEVTFQSLTDQLPDYHGRNLCIDPAPGEPVPQEAVETKE